MQATKTEIIFWLLLLVSIIANLTLEVLHFPFVETILKPIPWLCCIICTIKLLQKNKHKSLILLICGLVLSVFADLAYNIENGLLIGLVLISVIHILYASAIKRLGCKLKIIPCLAILIIGGHFLTTIYSYIDNNMHFVVVAYTGTVLILGFLGISFWSKSRFIAIGIIYFLISDMLFSIHNLVSPIPIGSVFIMLTYYLGQIYFVLGVHKYIRDDTIKYEKALTL